MSSLRFLFSSRFLGFFFFFFFVSGSVISNGFSRYISLVVRIWVWIEVSVLSFGIVKFLYIFELS